MFLRIFRYRVKPQMRDRHLAVQARAARLYEQHVQHSPKYFRRSGDPNSWVELHWYEDKAECQRVAATVADDLELARLWRDFQETLDADYPPAIEEYGEYELPRPVNASPFSQPPIDAPTETPSETKPSPAAPPVAAAVADEPPAAEQHESPREEPSERELDAASDEVSHDVTDSSAGHPADNGAAKRRDDAEHDGEPKPGAEDDDGARAQRTMWPQPPLPAEKSPAESATSENSQDDLVIEDDATIESHPSSSLSFNDGVWIVEPDDKPRYPRHDEQ
ncbi:MAG: hypothetical protein WD875_01720 [Pirellulales bacterium]